MKSLSQKQYHDHLYNVIKSERFLSKKGLGKEVPFLSRHIFRHLQMMLKNYPTTV